MEEGPSHRSKSAVTGPPTNKRFKADGRSQVGRSCVSAPPGCPLRSTTLRPRALRPSLSASR